MPLVEPPSRSMFPSPRRYRRYHRMVSGLDAVVMDVETGGLDPARHSIIQVGYISLICGIPLEWREIHVVPAEGTVIDEYVRGVNGWTGEPVDGAIPEHVALANLYGAASRCAGRTRRHRARVVGHNVDFDMEFLRYASRRSSSTVPKGVFSYRFIDTCRLAVPGVLSGTREKGGLDDLCREFGLWDGLSRAELGHRSALNDCWATLAVLYELLWELA